MQILIVNQDEVRRLLPMAECLDVMARTLAALARGEALLPLRQVLMLPGGQGAFGAMPAHLSSPPAVGIKVITVFPGNHGTEYDSHQGAVLGSGVQAATHLEAVALVRPLRRVRVWSRDPAHVARFVESARARHPFEI